MSIAFVCEHCRKRISVPDRAAGRQGKCPQCGVRVRVPAKATGSKALPPRTSRRRTGTKSGKKIRTDNADQPVLWTPTEQTIDFYQPAVGGGCGCLVYGLVGLILAGVIQDVRGDPDPPGTVFLVLLIGAPVVAIASGLYLGKKTFALRRADNGWVLTWYSWIFGTPVGRNEIPICGRCRLIASPDAELERNQRLTEMFSPGAGVSRKLGKWRHARIELCDSLGTRTLIMRGTFSDSQAYDNQLLIPTVRRQARQISEQFGIPLDEQL